MAEDRVAVGTARMLEARRSTLDAGARPIGWKVGYGSPAALARLHLEAPIVGFLTDRSRVAPGSTCSLAGWGRTLVEPEIAVHVATSNGKDPLSLIGALGMALEVVDPDPDEVDVERILAGNIFHRAVVLGPPHESRRGGVVEGLTMAAFKNGAEVAATEDLQANTGRVVDIVGQVAQLLDRVGEPLAPGQVIICGSVVPALPVGAGDEVTVRMGDLGELSIRFE